MIKLIIFDMDGTLYDLKDVIQMSYNMQVSYFAEKTGQSHEATKTFFAENGLFPDIRKESKSATEMFVRQGLKMEDWSKYRDNNFDVNAIDISKAVKDNLLQKFSEQFVLVLLSSNSYRCIQKVFSHINCSLSHFDEIICSDRYEGHGSFNKKEAMKLICEKYDIDISNMLSIGDRYKTDIEPFLELGGSGLLIKKNDSLKKILDDLFSCNLHSCPEYNYYRKIENDKNDN